MWTYCVETTVPSSRMLTIKELPFQAGDKVQIIVRHRKREQGRYGHYSLRGKPISYSDPFRSVAEGNWDACGFMYKTLREEEI